jgi:hypothetical protein
MKVSSPGFATVRRAIVPGSWFSADAEDDISPLGADMEGWDPSIGISVRRVVTIDLAQLRSETGLAIGSRLRLAGGWFCERTRTREVTDYFNLALTARGAEKSQHTLTVTAPGSDMANTLMLETRLVLISRADPSLSIAPRLPGSVLWGDRQAVQLESSQSRFPMEWADFETSIYRDSAAWALDWDPHDLECSTLGAVRLLINQKHERVAGLLRQRPATDEALLLWDALRIDIARQLITGALSNELFLRNPNVFGDGTLGATIRRMIATHFPHDSIGALKALADRSPTQFEAALQASLRAYH